MWPRWALPSPSIPSPQDKTAALQSVLQAVVGPQSNFQNVRVAIVFFLGREWEHFLDNSLLKTALAFFLQGLF